MPQAARSNALGYTTVGIRSTWPANLKRIQRTGRKDRARLSKILASVEWILHLNPVATRRCCRRRLSGTTAVHIGRADRQRSSRLFVRATSQEQRRYDGPYTFRGQAPAH